MKFHALAEIFPLLEGKEFATLVEEIRVRGLLEEIWLDRDGRIFGWAKQVFGLRRGGSRAALSHL
jgi:hypothetical protein